MSNFSWSYSQWDTFQTCPARYNYRFNKKLPDPPGPALERGKQIHADAERALCAPRTRIPKELQKVAPQLKELRRAQRRGDPVEVELQIGLNQRWLPTGYFDHDVWLRSKLDVVHYNDTRARVIDWKSGRMRDGYDEQLELYGVVVLSMEPIVEMVTTMMAFTDEGKTYGDDAPPLTRDGLPKLQAKWTERARRMALTKRFIARPNAGCDWCPYRRARGGPCKY